MDKVNTLIAIIMLIAGIYVEAFENDKDTVERPTLLMEKYNIIAIFLRQFLR